MAVTTPSYWQEERYQPLIEVETAYGNKVKIPANLLDTWKMLERMKGKYPLNVERAKAAAWFRRTTHNRDNQDLMLVYYEQFHE